MLSPSFIAATTTIKWPWKWILWDFPTCPRQATGIVIPPALLLLLQTFLTYAAAEGFIHTDAVISAVVFLLHVCLGARQPILMPLLGTQKQL